MHLSVIKLKILECPNFCSNQTHFSSEELGRKMPKKLKTRVEDLSEVCHNFGPNFWPGQPQIAEISNRRMSLRRLPLCDLYHKIFFSAMKQSD